jgi:ATP adenylyltransferase
LETLWSPWRAKYVASGSDDSQAATCVFCNISRDPANDEKNFVVYRALHNFVVLNLYPYTVGHLLIVPYEHAAELDAASKEITDELMDLTKRAQTVLRNVYKPAGFNIGMNLGAPAGAGIVGHMHVHVLPRWSGDTNFMSTVAQTRVISEDLNTTYAKLRDKF